MTTKWFYVTPQKTHQEFTEDDVAALVASGTLSRDTLIWNGTMQGWKPASEVKPEWFASASPNASASASEASVATSAADPVAAAPPATSNSTEVSAVPLGTTSPSTPVSTTSAPPLAPLVQNDPLALASMICGIVAVVMVLAGCVVFPCLGFLGLVVAIPAVITGHMALKRIKQGEAPAEGRGQAVAGLIMGYTTLGLLVIGGLLAVLGVGIFALAGSSGIPNQF